MEQHPAPPAASPGTCGRAEHGPAAGRGARPGRARSSAGGQGPVPGAAGPPPAALTWPPAGPGARAASAAAPGPSPALPGPAAGGERGLAGPGPAGAPGLQTRPGPELGLPAGRGCPPHTPLVPFLSPCKVCRAGAAFC